MYYFNKSASDLDLAEAAMLAGIPQSPNYNSPFKSMETAKNRQYVVLLSMKNNGIITDKEMEDAYNENNFMDVCYEGALTRATMTDMYCISYLYSTDNVEHKIKEFFNLPMKVRYAYFLMILSINKGNAVTCKDVFNKDDLMAKWISALHLYIRPDDDLLSAFLRINFAIAKVDFNIYNKRLTINDASFSITGRSFNLFSVFGNDRSFIEEIASNPEGTIKEFC